LPWRAGAFLYAGGPPLLWYEAGQFTLILMAGHDGEAAEFAAQPGCAVQTYEGYAYERQPAGAQNLQATLAALIRSSRGGPIGIESGHLPVALLDVLTSQQPPDTIFTPIDGWLAPLRLIRTNEELARMRANFALIAEAQAACPAEIRPGNTELAVWHAAHTALQQAAGTTLPLGNDCTVGRRMGGPPQPVEILPTDSFIVDLSTIWRGYWSDSCVTYYATAPSPQQIAMHRAVAEALELAISLAIPGARCRDIDQAVRQQLLDQGYPTYPHHTGHGIGVIGHEAPRVTPHSDERLQAGMVIMLEPGIYYPGETGVRLEHAVLVTASGPEILTPYDLNIP
ncbi:MAG: aminopeptidase P family protein, partial [Anaerolineales bacterium]|nr:aminopeptidase P family protein [Anaerolineales bacterium]